MMRVFTPTIYEPTVLANITAIPTTLVGDIGGTNSNFGLFVQGNSRTLILSMRLPSQQIANFTDTMRDLLGFIDQTYHVMPRHVVLGIAGLVLPGARRVKPTHLDITIDVKELQNMIPTTVCNDFELVVWGVEALDAQRLRCIHQGVRRMGTRVYIGAGTGLGHALGLPTGTTHIPVATEAGHTDFAPSTQRDWQLVHELQEKTGFSPSWEQVLSGSGMSELYAFLARNNQYPKTRVTIEIHNNRLQPDYITTYATQDPLCADTYTWYRELYARYAKNSIIGAAALGGLYIAGGIAAHNPALFTDPAFMQTVMHSGQQQTLLQEAPITLITDYNVSLYGGAVLADRLQMIDNNL